MCYSKRKRKKGNLILSVGLSLKHFVYNMLLRTAFIYIFDMELHGIGYTA